MLKIWKSEYKSLVIAPAVALILCTVLALVAGIKMAIKATVNNDFCGPLDNYDNILLILIFITVSVLVVKSWRKDDIYKLVGVKEYRLIFSRAALLFFIMCLVTLILVAESSIVWKVYYNKTGASYTLAQNSYSMTGMPAESWCIIPAVGLFAVVIYFMGLAVTPIVRHAQRLKTLRYIVAIAAIAGLITGFFALAPLCGNILPSLNFNKPFAVTDGVFSQSVFPLPLNWLYFYIPQDVINGTMVMVNVLSLGELFFCFVCCAFCYGLYLLGYRRNDQRDWVKYKKSQTALIASLSAMIVCAVVLLGVFVATPDLGDEGFYMAPEEMTAGQMVKITNYEVGEYLDDFHYDVIFEFYDPNGYFSNDENGNPVYNYEDGRTVTFFDNYKSAVFSDEGIYVIIVAITQKYTLKGRQLFSRRYVVTAE